MQPIKTLANTLDHLADENHYLFSLGDLKGVIPNQSTAALKTMVSRAEKNNLLRRICRGVYLYPKVNYPIGLLLYHVAAHVRADEFNYISFESALSDGGLISQIPVKWVSLMSTGRSSNLNCGEFGHIEFVHTKTNIEELAEEVTYDSACHLWRASVKLALKDMRKTRRSTDLVDWEAAGEFI